MQIKNYIHKLSSHYPQEVRNYHFACLGVKDFSLPYTPNLETLFGLKDY
jgi:hypothetical protein